MLEWLIIGGGVHGTALSNQLVKTRGLTENELRVVDPHDKPLAVWRHCTLNTGMRYLRSPGTHNLDVGPGALLSYARNIRVPEVQFFSSYKRPSLSLFNAHCQSVIEAQQLSRFRHQAHARLISRAKNGSFILQTDNHDFEAKRIILALGSSTELAMPDWALRCDTKDSIVHVFSKQFDLSAITADSTIVIGSGISAAQCALALSEKNAGKVLLLHSRCFRTRQFDADPCWLEQRCLAQLSAKENLEDRRRVVNSARHRGSFPEEIKRQLDKAMESGQLICRQAAVQNAHRSKLGVTLHLSNGAHVEAEQILLATGFAQQIPGGDFLEDTISELELTCAPCGYPITDRHLQWQENLFVTGSLAELTLGPSARNIIGARLAADRIFSVNRKSKIRPEKSFYYFKRRRSK